jgi:hypothetical protein
MNFLGVCRDSHRVYQGRTSSGSPINPHPVLLPVSFVGDIESSDTSSITEVPGFSSHVFKEDYFDPITQIRRGSIFRTFGNQPQTWQVQDPYRADLKKVRRSRGTAQEVDLITYQSDPLNDLRNIDTYPEVILGAEPFSSIWKILSIESSVSRLPLITLKAYRFFGAVPTLLDNNIPEECIQSLHAALEKVANSSHRLGPTDVVDRCRDALSIVFGTLVSDRNIDLSASVNKYVKQKNKSQDNLISWSGKMVARLHSRGKPNEVHKNKLRELSEEDAQLALRCLWLVLVELHWAH